MEKLTIPEIAALLSAKNEMPRYKAENLISSMFEVIQKGLERESVVKVKGLGTFKIIDVEARESVNVNTGERVLIDRHGKITFTPDSTMKELINKPFSQFETVILNEGVDFEDEKEEELPELEPEDEPQPEPIMISVMDDSVEPVNDAPVASVPDAVEDTEETETEDAEATEDAKTEEDVEATEDAETAEDAESEAEVLPLIDSEEEVVAEETETLFAENEETAESEETAEVEEKTESEEAPESEETQENEDTEEELDNDIDYSEEPRDYGWLWWLVLGVAACAVSFYLGYLYGQMNREAEKPQTAAVEKAVVEPQVQKEPAIAVTDTVKKDSIKAEETPKPEVKETPKPVVKETPKPEVKVAAPVMDKYEKADARVRTGAYRITGLAQEVTVKAGDTMEKISKRYLGEGMVCYMSVYNGLSDNEPLKQGQKLKVPQLVLKKKLKK